MLVQVINGVLLCIQPILLRRILTSIEGPPIHEDGLIHYEVKVPELSLLALAFAPIAEVRGDLRAAYLYTAISFILLIIRAHVGVVNESLRRRYVTRFVQHSFLCGAHHSHYVDRARDEVIGSIYAKALVRIDTSGIVDSKSNDSTKDGKADMGKLVSLVSVDANRLQFIPAILNCATETPVNIIITGAFLYSILGYSAFVGYVMFIPVRFAAYWLRTSISDWSVRSGHAGNRLDHDQDDEPGSRDLQATW